jgi:glucose-fructose oxidoreductase
MGLVHKSKKIRYAVIGLGHIAQDAILPAFKKLKRNSTLTTIISQHEEKLHYFANKYKIKNRYLFSNLKEALSSNEFDAIYISTPNDTHRFIAELASDYGIHIICEKPLSVSYRDALSMIESAKKNNVKLMTAYRLHFHPAHQEILDLVNQKRLGEIKIFNSTFSMDVKDIFNFRLQGSDKGGGPLHDIGVYCINAARRFFQSEPLVVFAFSNSTHDLRFKDCDETVTSLLKFPGGKMASFTICFGGYRNSDLELIGSLGRIKLERAYEYSRPMTLKIYENKKIISRKFIKVDQFANEIMHFSDCILNDKNPSISIHEGSLDLKIIEALLLSLDLASPINVEEIIKQRPLTETTKKPKLALPLPKFFGTW